ncbi:MAG TPA: stalk domain-containing protein [Symbiobacteriaceae bacterium]|nr:stalk domain-containing protein [Symbiobacteriaceae bacterium]
MKRVWRFLLSLCLLIALISPVAAAEQNVKVLLDDVEVQFDQQPFVESGRTLVPIRVLAELLGFEVAWDEPEQKITLTKGDTTIVLWVDSTKVLVNGKEGTIDVPAKVLGGRTFVPIRFIAETLGTHVGWDNDKQAAVVTSGTRLTEKAMRQQQAAPNYKMTADIAQVATVTGEGLPPAGLTVPTETHIDGHFFNNEMLLKVTTSAAGQQAVIDMAGLNGKLYQKATTAVALPVAQGWMQIADYDPNDVGSMVNGVDVSRIDKDLMNQAAVTVLGTEDLDGTSVVKVKVDLSKLDMQSLIDQLSKAGVTGAGGQAPNTTYTINNYVLTYWIDPVTSVLRKVDMAMDLVIVTSGAQGTQTVALTITGAVKYQPTSDPIAWPTDLPR